MSSTENGLKSSEEFLGELIDEWVLVNLSDNDSESESSGSNWSLRVDDRCDYKCGICGEQVSDYALPKHHYHKHGDVSFDMKMYEKIEFNQTIQCYLCGSQVLATELADHQKECPMETFSSRWESSSSSEEVSIATSEFSSDDLSIGSRSVILSRIFRCEACGALVFEDDLDEHHESIHQDILLNVNIYELFKVAQQELCDICGQWVENMDSHYSHHHVNNEASEDEEEFVLVRMSKEQAQKFGGCIVEEDGHLVMRDSE